MIHYFGDRYSKTPDGGLVGFSKEYKDNYGTVRNIHELIRSASLVTVELGIGDVIYRPVELAFSRQGIDISNTDSIIAGVKTIMSEMIKGYSYWYRNYPRLLDYLKLNTKKDCDIVLVGVINPLFNMNITSEDYIPLGNLISVLTNAMNRRYKELADEYGFKFVDISNVETGSTMDDYNIWTYLTNAEHYQYYTHPYAFDKDDLNQTISKDYGYAQIANWIYDELKGEKGFSLKTTVKLDPGRLENIETVKVNGIKWNLHYYDKDGNLYVPCLSPFADKLSISGTGSDGKTQLSVYKLKYDNGYSAIRTYTTNDLDRAVETTKAQIKGLIGL